jgi:hypothetical protein
VRKLEVNAMDQDFESFNDQDDEWLSELETRAIDLENQLFDWRESRTRELTESRSRERADAAAREVAAREVAEAAYRREAAPGMTRAAFRRSGGTAGQEPGAGLAGAVSTAPRTGSGRGRPEGVTRPRSAEDRTRALIDHGRQGAGRASLSRGRKITIITAVLLAAVTVMVMVVFRKGASWPPSVATVQSEITTACQNPNVASEPGQVDFACGKSTSQILWIFALMTSDDRANFTDAKSGRQGLEPITPTQGGEVAWSLDLHHPYNPLNPVDSLAVAARAINNIIGGATLTNAKGKPSVQAGLESNPSNCARYTGSSAMISRAGFPDVCAAPIDSLSGQAALVGDVYQEWMVGATAVAANNVSVLFENANNPGNSQVQAILKTLPGAS